MFKFELEAKLKDEFLDLDYYQRQLLNNTLKQLQELEKYIKNLEV